MSGRLRWLAAFAAYTALTIAFTWPLGAQLASAFPNDPFDPSLSTWILWWNAHTLPLTARWWNAPMFWPLSGTLALSEHLLGISMLTTPLQWLGSSPLAAYNVAVLLSFPLCALAAHALVFALTDRHDAGVIAGLVFGFSPYRVSHLSHLQILWTFGIPLTLFAAHRFASARHRSWLVVFGAAWLVQALSNGYCLMFLPVLIVCWLVWFGRDRSVWRPVGAAWLAATLPLVPILSGYERVHTSLGLHRSLPEILTYSADLTALFTAPSRLILWRPLSRWARAEGELFPGAFALALIAIGIGAGVQRLRGGERCARKRTPWTWLLLATIAAAVVAVSPVIAGPWQVGSLISVSSVAKPLTIAAILAAVVTMTTRSFRAAWQGCSPLAFYTGAAVLTFLLSLGPYPTLAGYRVLYRAPYAWLMELPGYSGLRAPARFGMLFIVCVAVAAGCAFAATTGRLSPRARRLATAAAAAVILVESWPAMSLVLPPRSIRALGPGVPDVPIVELPLGLVERDTAALYRSMTHRQPIVNGYSGYSPPHYVILEIALRDEDVDALAELARGESLIVAVDRQFQFDRWTAALASRHAELVAVDGDEHLYRLSAPPVGGAGQGERLMIQSIAASVAEDRAARLLDGDWSTAWGTNGPQQGGETLLVDLGQERHVTAVRMDFGPLAGDVPRRLTVECAGERSDWQRCWQGSALAAAVRGALEDPRHVPMVLPIDRPGVRRLRLKETAADADRPWSIVELAVFGR